MAVAALAAPELLNRLSPDEAIKFIESAEKAAVMVRSFAHKTAHSASLTEDEGHLGWIPVIIILYRLWQSFFGPQVKFTLDAQIGVADVLNRFGAGIDTTGLRQISAKIDTSIKPFKPPPQGSNSGSPPTIFGWDTTL